MRDFVLLCAAALLLAGCEFFETDLSDRRPGYEGPSDGEAVAEGTPYRVDTSVYICGVRVLDDYNWRRDTAFGIPRSELVVLRDGAVVMTVPCRRGSGVTPDADRHFLIDGDLFSYECPGDSTLICRNGRPLLHYPTRERLCGIRYLGGSWYTLGQDNSPGGTLRLRRDGRTLWTRSGGESLCRFGAAMQSRYGAFAYSTGSIVFRFCDDGIDYLYSDGSISQIDSVPAELANMYVKPFGAKSAIYRSSTGTCSVAWGETMTVVCSESSADRIFGKFYHFNYSIATEAFGEAVVLLNPADTLARPLVWRDGKMTPTAIENGYLTGVETVIGPAR